MSCSVLFALKHAVDSARADTGRTDHFELGETDVIYIYHDHPLSTATATA